MADEATRAPRTRPFWRCVKAFLPRIIHQKSRERVKTFLEFALPLFVAGILLGTTWLARKVFVGRVIPATRYLSDASLSDCPFGAYGPFADMSEGTVFKEYTKYISPEDINCYRFFGVNAAGVISSIVAPSSGPLGGFGSLLGLPFSAGGSWGGFDPFERFSLQPFREPRKGSFMHFLRTMYALERYRDLGINLIEAEKKGGQLDPECTEFSDYVRTISHTLWLPPRNTTVFPAALKPLDVPLFVCGRGEDGRLSLELNTDTVMVPFFPYGNRNLLYQSSPATSFGGISLPLHRPSVVGLQLLLAGFFRHKLAAASQGDRVRSSTEAPELDIALNKIIYVAFRDSAGRKGDGATGLLNVSKLTELENLCRLCRWGSKGAQKQSSISPVRHLADCSAVGRFLSFTAPQLYTKWEEAVSAPDKGGAREIGVSSDPCSNIGDLSDLLSPQERMDRLLTVDPLASFGGLFRENSPSSPGDREDTGLNAVKALLQGESPETRGDAMHKMIATLGSHDALGTMSSLWTRSTGALSAAKQKLHWPFHRVVLENVQFRILTHWIYPIMQYYDIPEIAEAAMPSPAVHFDRWQMILFGAGWMHFLFAQMFALPLLSVVEILTSDKESKMRELLRIVGATDTIRFAAVYIFYGVAFLIIITLFCFIARRALASIPFIVLASFFYIQSYLIIGLGIAIAGCFSKTHRATVVASSLYFFGCILYPVFSMIDSSLFHIPQTLILLFVAPAPMMHGFTILLGLEMQRLVGDGGPRESLSIYECLYSSHKGVTLLHCAAMTFVAAFVYTVLGLYFHQLWPGEFGVPRRWYFPLELLRGPKSLRKSKSKAYQALPASEGRADPTHFEQPSPEVVARPLILEASDLTKRYPLENRAGEFLEAVSHFSVNLHESELYVLLGHNGAGKSTLVNMMAGIIPATEGEVIICGHKVGTAEARRCMGYCPQFDTVYKFLTVREHLGLFGVLRGLTSRQAADSASELAAELDLAEKLDDLAEHLSGGQRRRLSVAIAIAGDTKMVFLDEPSTGLDLFTRRAFWAVLQRLKAGRAILVSTHQMDEAEVLGTRIAILAAARLVCSGSALFLKTAYKVGYSLTITKSPDFTTAEEERLIRTILGTVANATITSNIALEITFRLPLNSTTAIAPLLSKLEDPEAARSMGVAAFSMSGSTLTEVFLKAGSAKDDRQNSDLEIANAMEKQSRRASVSSTIERLSSSSDVGNSTLRRVSQIPVKNLDYTGSIAVDREGRGRRESAIQRLPTMTGADAWKHNCLSLWFAQLRALGHKRFLYHLRHRLDLFRQVFGAPLTFVGWLIVLKLVTVTIFTFHVNPIQAMSNYPYARVMPHEIPYAFDAGILDEVRERERLILAACDPTQWRPIEMPASTPDVIDDFLLRERSKASALEEGDPHFERSYFGIFYESIPSRPTQVTMTLLHDSTFTNALPASFTMYSDCLSRAGGGKGVEQRFALRALRDEKVQGALTWFFDILIAVLLVVSVATQISAAPSFHLREEAADTKDLQRIAGVNPTAYWLVNLFFDLVLFMIPTVLLFSVTAALYPQHFLFQKGGRLRDTMSLLALFGCGGVPFAYFLALLCVNSDTLVTAVLRQLGSLTPLYLPAAIAFSFFTPRLWCFLKRALVLFPHMAISDALFPAPEQLGLLRQLAFQRDSGSVLCSPHKSLALCACVLFLSVLLIDEAKTSLTIRGFVGRAYLFFADSLEACCGRPVKGDRRRSPAVSSLDDVLDSGVEEEKRRVLALHRQRIERKSSTIDVEEGHPLVDGALQPGQVEVVGLTKRFWTRCGTCFSREQDDELQGNTLTAVDDIYLAVAPKECFGLLGVNGSGKTTTVRMLTRLRAPSSGTASTAGVDIHSPTFTLKAPLGYAAQADALFDTLTCEEHLMFYATVAGVARKYRRPLSEALIEALGLSNYKDRQARHLSGGTRRKLSVGLTLLRNPVAVYLGRVVDALLQCQLVLTDEPSSGVDPAARRRLWALIASATRQGDRAVILTTHLMEECEALCERLTFMRHGRLTCIGSPAKLKAQLGRFYQLELSLCFPTEEEALTTADEEDLPVATKISSGLLVPIEETVTVDRDQRIVSDVIAMLEGTFPGVSLIERLGTTLKFSLPKREGLRLSQVFATIELHKVGPRSQ